MGTSVLTPTFRYHPAIVAQAFATLGCLYPGRVVLGLGTGESMNEVPLGFEWPDGKERFARFREAVRLIRELWAERAGHASRASTTAPTRRRSTTGPTQPVPIYLAGSGPAATRFAGRRRRRVHHHVRQGPRAVHRHAAAGGARRRREGRPRD